MATLASKAMICHPKANRDEAIHDIEGMTEGGIKFIIGKLQQLGLLKREDGRKMVLGL